MRSTKKAPYQTIATGVFARQGKDQISSQFFYGILGSSVVWGLMLTAVVANYIIQTGYIPGIEGIIIGIVLPIIGALMAIKSDNPYISFLGYHFIIIPFGIILGPYVSQFQPQIISKAFTMTALITAMMTIAGTLYPQVFAKMGRALFLALSGLVIIRILSLFFPILNLTILDYLGAGIFSLYIGYDMYRANHIPKTLDNAIDISVDLYLDIVNLFLYLLRIYGNRD